MSELRLTSLSSCAGCAAKIGQSALAQILRDLPSFENPALLIGSATSDDAGIYKISSDLALVQTLDFFTPIVDDPFDFGQIAAANALSDIYAMGGRPITAMNIVAMPTDKLSPEIIAKILRGGAEKTKEANCCLLGGHSIRAPEPIYGLSVTGTVHPEKIIANSNAKPGDLLVLTKPIGTGIATTALKRNLASTQLRDAVIKSMKLLNTPGQTLGESQLVRAGTDVTGFGLLGHLANICRASKVSARIDANAVPIFSDEISDLIAQDCIPGGTRTNLQTANEFTDWSNTSDSRRILLADAQTSGPLLLCVPPQRIQDVLDILIDAGTPTRAVIGSVIESADALVIAS